MPDPCPARHSPRSGLLPKVCQNIFSRHNTDKHTLVVHDGNEVLVHHLAEEVFHRLVNLDCLIVPAALDGGDRHILKQLQIRKIAVL